MFLLAKWASPMFESEEPRNIMDNRTSLSVEVARMWKRQPSPIKKAPEPDARDAKILEEGMNGLLGQLLVSQALVDAELYNTLTFEQLSDLKKVRRKRSVSVYIYVLCIYILFVFLSRKVPLLKD